MSKRSKEGDFGVMSKRSRINKEDDEFGITFKETSRIISSKDDGVPVELIHHIQSLLSLEEGGRTCILSKSWLRAWYTLPTLKLTMPNEEPIKLCSIHDSYNCSHIKQKTHENQTNYNKLIHTTLQRYQLDTPIHSFRLRLDIIEENILEDVQNWLRLVVSKTSLSDLSLDIRVLLDDDDNRHLFLPLPNHLFSSQGLHTIHVTASFTDTQDLTNLRLRICSTNLIKCVSLRVLDLECVFINQDVLNNLFSTCRLLEKVKLSSCGGLKNVKVKNLLRLTELDISSIEEDDLWDITNVPSLCSFSFRHMCAFWKQPIPFQIDSLASVTHLCIEGGLLFNNSFFYALVSKFHVLESLTLVIHDPDPDLKDLVFTSSSLKWLTLHIFPFRATRPLELNLHVYAPKLLSFIYTGRIPRLLFRTTPPKQLKLTFNSWETLGQAYFDRFREALNPSSQFDINITSQNLDSLVGRFNFDVDDLRTRDLSFPVRNVVELVLHTCLDEHAWEQSRFFDALFCICHPSYIKASYKVIRKIPNTTDHLKEVLLKNPRNGNWEALTTSWKSILHTLTTGHLECKLIWFPSDDNVKGQDPR